MFNSFVRCQTTTCKIYLQKIVHERFQAEAFQKEEDRSKVADCLCPCNQNFFERIRLASKISFVFPQLSLKYILVLVSRVPICGQTLPSAAATAVDVVFYILLFLQQLLPAVNITGRSIACLLIIEPYVKL